MRFRLAMIAVLTLATGCRDSAPPALSSAIPEGATAIAAIDLAALRASQFYAKLPPMVIALAEPLRDASTMMLAWDGKDLLLLARGKFANAPPGYTIIAPGIAAAGAHAQLRTGRSGAAAFPAVAGTIWGAVRGDGRLPLTGNLANAYNLLREAGYTTLSVQLHDTVDLSLTAQCPAPENARRFEQSLRAIVTLAAAASQPGIATLLHAVHIQREDRIVHATLSATPEALALLLR